ncbi:MAG: ferritin-like domain-containing protein [Verrucomicrobiota bacterium]
MTSQDWTRHFRQNLENQRVDWQQTPRLDRTDDRKLVRSLQAWQKGETSDGSHLVRAAEKYARRTNDPDYLEAVALFVREEQKHGENLGKYLDRIDAPRLEFDFGDWLFRRVRYFNTSMELWTISVIIVEIFAQIYYASIAKASACPLLGSICKDILTDEAHHIRFQSERLRTIMGDRIGVARWLSINSYRTLLLVVTISIWIGHSCVFKQAGMGFRGFWKRANRRISRILTESGSSSPSTLSAVEQVTVAQVR